MAERIGASVLDAALAGFYQDHVGTAARMQDLIDRIELVGATDIDDLVDAWLKQVDCP